jgi:hypothetical protein
MEPSDIRRRVLQTLDHAKRRSVAHREDVERASTAFDRLLPLVAATWRQVANILKVEGHAFSLHSPAGALRFASERSADDFVEIALETARRPVALVGRTRFTRGRQVIDRELIVAEADQIATLDEERLLDFLLQELEPFVER